MAMTEGQISYTPRQLPDGSVTQAWSWSGGPVALVEVGYLRALEGAGPHLPQCGDLFTVGPFTVRVVDNSLWRGCVLVRREEGFGK